MCYKFDHDFHIHSKLSSCSNDPEQTTQRILEYAKKNNLTSVCVTDHFWDKKVEGASNWYAPQDFDHISQNLPLPKDDEVKFLFGCETELNKFGTVGICKETIDKMDFVIIPTTHFHMTDYTLSTAQLESPKTRAQAWIDRLGRVLDMDLPFYKIGIAHLTCQLVFRNDTEKLLETFDLIPTDEMHRLFSKAKNLGVGIELNAHDMANAIKNPPLFKPYIAAKECGCKFYVGSDTHHPKDFDMVPDAINTATEILGLDERDKFILGI